MRAHLLYSCELGESVCCERFILASNLVYCILPHESRGTVLIFCIE